MEQQNIQINNFEGGMDMDTDVSFITNNTYRYSLNMRLTTQSDGTNGVLLNIDHIKRYNELPQLKYLRIVAITESKIPNDEGLLENTAILLTYDRMEKTHNHIYVVNGFDKGEIKSKCILKTIWRINEDTGASLIFNYETKNTYKLYVNDPTMGMKIINLNEYKDEWGDKEVISNPSFFNSNPSAVLLPLTLDGYVSGNLKAGAYLYFYKLYTKSGIETPLSSGSEIIYIAKANMENGEQSGGLLPNAVSNTGIRLSLELDNDLFDYIKLYRVYWADNINDPKVNIFTEDKIPVGKQTITINDAVQQSLSDVSLEELNDIIPYVFQALNAISFKNRIFFANVESKDWDIPKEYDTRVYRANKKGLVKLLNASGNYEAYDVPLYKLIDGSYKMEEDADAINPMNSLDLYPIAGSDEEYAYDRSGNYGGEGINISYTIVHTETFESSRSGNGVENVTFTDLQSANRLYDTAPNVMQRSINIYPTGGSNLSYPSIDFEDYLLISYANPFIASKFASYQRDEIYRFGIIFYNEKNIPTPVHWIGDIRFPSGDTDGFNAFRSSSEQDVEVIARPLGINFVIKNFPDGAVAAEIVRCDRTFNDRTIIAQGMVNNTIHYEDFSFGEFDPNESNGANDIRCNILPTIDGLLAGLSTSSEEVNVEWSGHYNPEEEVKTFASPEICMNKTSNVVSPGNYICPVYKAVSSINGPAGQYGIPFGGGDSLGGRMTSAKTAFGTNSIPEGSYSGMVIKYYNLSSANSWFRTFTSSNKTSAPERFITDVVSSKIARNDLPIQDNNEEDAFKEAYIDVFAGKNYTNNAVGIEIFTIAGINCLLEINTALADANHILYQGYSTHHLDNSLFTLICNIKQRVLQYGGVSYLARSVNSYISCGGYISFDNPLKTIFGGDTFLVNFEYQHALMFTANDFNVYRQNFHKPVFVYLPLETTINTYMRSDNYFLKSKTGYIFTNPGAMNGNSQDFALYEYNSVYSLSDGGVNYSSGSTNKNISSNEPNRYRIICTEAKSAGEMIDSWSKSKFANTLDLNSTNGSITKLITYNNNLYAFQETALNVLSVNERSLISDQSGAQLVLGVGGVLNNFDTLVSGYGAGVLNDKSVISSSQSIYWYDSNKNVICSYGGNGFRVLSKEKKVQSFLNGLAQVNNITMLSLFNDKTNELWIKNSRGSCLIYNEQADCFTSFYTHRPEMALRFYDRTVTIIDNTFYRIDFFGLAKEVEDRTAKLEIVVNSGYDTTKVFDTQVIVGDLNTDINDKYYNMNYAQFSTKTQNSFKINASDIQCREDDYVFAIPREDRGEQGEDDEKEMDNFNNSFSPRMRGKYMLCKYEFDCNNDRSVRIPAIKTKFRQSYK